MGKTNRERREQRAREVARAETMRAMRRRDMAFYATIAALGLLLTLEVFDKI